MLQVHAATFGATIHSVGLQQLWVGAACCTWQRVNFHVLSFVMLLAGCMSLRPCRLTVTTGRLQLRARHMAGRCQALACVMPHSGGGSQLFLWSCWYSNMNCVVSLATLRNSMHSIHRSGESPHLRAAGAAPIRV